MTINPSFLRRLKSKEYRLAFLRQGATSWLAYQIKALRDQRGWTQSQLGEAMGGKPQSRVALIEDPDYGKWNMSTLLDVADAFDVALQCRFVPWPEYVKQAEDASEDAMRVSSFDGEEFDDFESKSASETLDSQVATDALRVAAEAIRSARRNWSLPGNATSSTDHDFGVDTPPDAQYDWYTEVRTPVLERLTYAG